MAQRRQKASPKLRSRSPRETADVRELLKREREEHQQTLQRERATSEILRVIAESQADVQPVFDTIVRNAVRLCGGTYASAFRYDGEQLHRVATTHKRVELEKILADVFPTRPDKRQAAGRAILAKGTIKIEDVLADPAYGHRHAIGRRMLAVPMLRSGEPIGVIVVTWAKPGPISERQEGLLKTFADQAVIAIDNVRLFNETKEGLERQTATAEILKVIAGSPSDIQPVLEAVGRNAARLCEANNAVIFRLERDLLQQVASYGGIPTSSHPSQGLPVDRSRVTGRAVVDRQTIHVHDLAAETSEFPDGSRDARRDGHRTTLATPLIRDGVPIGAILIRRMEVRPFSDKQIALLKTFADQAAIAIENVRLFNETKEALERQTGTADILKVISGSPSDVRPVFQAVAKRAAQLCNAVHASVWLPDGDVLRAVARVGPDMPVGEIPIRKTMIHGRAFLEQRTLHLEDVVPLLESEYPDARANQLKLGFRTFLSVPMAREGRAIGTIGVWRNEVKPFSPVQIELLETFAAQAVIAIENARLFNETKEALERQTASADVLRVIGSSPSNLQPVFDSILENAMRLCDANLATVGLYDGKQYRHVAQKGGSAEYIKFLFGGPFEPNPQYTLGRMIAEGKPFHAPDYRELPDYKQGNPRSVATVEIGGTRTYLAVPMLKDGHVIGGITVRRTEVRPFTQKQIDLVRTFADQAVIAVENARLFNETKEALERQTATAEILKVIAGSPSDAQPVFDAIARSAVGLCGGMFGAVFRYDGEKAHFVAHHGFSAEALELMQHRFPRIPQGFVAQSLLEGAVSHSPDVFDGIRSANPELHRALGTRAYLGVPMLLDGRPIGAISVFRREPGPFADTQIAVLQTFAAQAVIAIENVRLFNETKEALERQTATSELLKVIGQSTSDLQPVFDTLAENAVKVCHAAQAFIFRFDQQFLRVVATCNVSPELRRFFADNPVAPGRSTVAGRAAAEGRTIHVHDVRADPEYRWTAHRVDPIRTVLTVPILRGGEVLGVIGVNRPEVRPFSDRQIELLESFASQAVIAIENVRLFRELQERTQALTKSVGQLTALGEVGQAISSTLDLETVLKTIVSRAVQLADLDGGWIYEYDHRDEGFYLRAAARVEEEILEVSRKSPVRLGEGAVGRAGATREPVVVEDLLDPSYQSRVRELLIKSGSRALLVVPLLGEDLLLGALAVSRKSPGRFAPDVIGLLKTFATQSAVAIQNARLFEEIAEKGKQLEVASQHKSQFLASMSHELRTPLNAILGFNEMMLDGLCGEVPAGFKDPLDETQKSGKHLLRLINNVLDLAKIEAGRMELAPADYSVHDTVESVRSTLRPLAAEKGLEFLANVPGDIPLAYGDAGRITQCLMNLAGNSLKFTKEGRVEISVRQQNGQLRYCVTDTGIGIPLEKISSLFTEFKQTDAAIASEYGGTGLGLSITRKFIEMHGGRIWVESEVGKGSAFIFEIPLKLGK